jgi:hypothetical protein
MQAARASALVEREPELAQLREGLQDARAGRGSVAFVEGPAGQGKTALLRALRAEAAGSGVAVLAASGAELERPFAFGVVRQLFEPVLRRTEAPARERLFTGTAALAAPVFAPGVEPADGSDVIHARLHGLHWMCATLADDGPLLVVVDDAHWADAPSMRFLDVLARRVEDLPVLLVVAARPGEPGAEQDILDALATSPAARAVLPAALGPGGVRVLLERALGSTPGPAFLGACVEVTAGNALLVTELARTLAAEGYTGADAEAGSARRAVPGTVARTVLGRLRRLSADALAVARALAMLGERSTARRAAALAGVDPARAHEATAALVRTGIVDADGLRFTHPLVQDAVLRELLPGERSDWHRRAARVLRGDGVDAGVIAPHLLATEPEGDPEVVPDLLAAGRRALSDGAAEIAVRLLRRALAEPPADADRQEVLLALGEAGARVGEPDAAAHLAAAVDGPDPGRAARAALVGVSLLALRDRPGEGAALLARAAARIEGTGHPLEARLQDTRLQVLPFHEPLLGEYERRLADVGPDARPALLSHLALARALGGARAEEVLDLARRALGSGALVRESGDRLAYMHALNALLAIEAADELAAALDDAVRVARRSGSRVTLGTVTYARSTWEHHFGDLRVAVDEAERAMELLSAAGARAALVPARVALAAALLDRGSLAAADAVVAAHPAADRVTGFHGMHGVRARLRLAQAASTRRSRRWPPCMRSSAGGAGACPTARPPGELARALVGRGAAGRGLAVADEELALARARGRVPRARAQLARACLPAAERLAPLEAAAGAGRLPLTEARAQALGRS